MSTPSLRGRKESTGPAWFACCTLLGPEGPEPPGEPGWDCTSGPSPVWRNLCGGRQGGYRPYFENYTVDASILDLNTRVFKSHWLSVMTGLPASVGLSIDLTSSDSLVNFSETKNRFKLM